MVSLCLKVSSGQSGRTDSFGEVRRSHDETVLSVLEFVQLREKRIHNLYRVEAVSQ